MRTDTEIRNDVVRQLAWDPKIDDSKIRISVEDGVVTLKGEVPYFADKYEAEKVVKAVFGLTGIAEDLKVTPFGATFNDTDLTDRVVNLLKWNVSVPETVKPVVRDGWVTLEGTVTWNYQRDAAASAVRYLSGVKGVTNDITIDNPVEPTDVSSRISEALARNARIDADRITVNADGHTAILDGSVRSVAERDEAEVAAWSAPGVNSVQDHLQIRY